MIAEIDGTAMLARVERWCSINTGTGNLSGLGRMVDELEPALALLPGTVCRRDGAAVSMVDERGHELERQFGIISCCPSGRGPTGAFC